MSARTRNRGTYGTDVVVKAVSYPSLSYTNISNPGNGVVEEMTDEVTPSFNRLKKRGAVIFNSMVHEKNSYYQSGTGYRFHHASNPANYEEYPGSTSQIFTGLGHERYPTLLHSGSDIRKLAVEVSTAVRSNRNRADANLFETLAELDKTAEMVKHPINAWVAKLHGRPSLAKVGGAAAQNTANFYLMMRYGVMPLIHDISTVLVNVKAIPPFRKTTRGSQSSSLTKTSLRTQSLSWVFGATIETECEETCSVRGMSLDEDVADGLNRLRQLGFSGKDLITLPLELVRLSFVVDWFVNVGDVFGAMADKIVANNNLGSCLTYTINRTERTYYQAYPEESLKSTYVADVIPHGTVLRAYDKKERVPGLLVPGLVIKNDFGFSRITRTLDAAAIVKQLTSGVVGSISKAYRGRGVVTS